MVACTITFSCKAHTPNNQLLLVLQSIRVCERRKLRVNVSKSKVMRCSRYGNGDRMNVILNGEPLEEVDCFKYLGSQKGCGTQNE